MKGADSGSQAREEGHKIDQACQAASNVIDGAKEVISRSIVLAPDLAEVARARRFLAEIATEASFPEPRVFDITVAGSEAMAGSSTPLTGTENGTLAA